MLNQNINDLRYMQLALELAHKGAELGEVPVGALVVLNDTIIGTGYNSPITNCDPSGHAEIIALRNAALAINNYRLVNTTIYVTLEPCLMCLGAILYARVVRVVFGAVDVKNGALGGKMRVLEQMHTNHTISYTGQVCETECSKILQDFFAAKRA